jgi:hypothetical protein
MTQGPAPAATAAGPEKTRVFESSAPAAAPDDEKTKVFERPAARPVVALKPAAPAPAPAPVPAPAPTPVAALRFRYCPSCTNANPPDAVSCSRCGTPLGQSGGAAAVQAKNWGMYIAIGVAGLLAIVLVVVLMAKR